MHLLYTVNAPRLAGLYSGLPQRIPMHLLYTVNVPWLAGLYSGVITSGSAYTKAILYCDCTSVSFASTLYGECTYYSWTIYSGLPQRIPMHLLYTVNAPIIAGLYSGLPQRIPMHLFIR